MENTLELIKKVRNGDEGAFEQLLQEHRRMIYSIINSFNLESGDYAVDKNDLFQEGSLMLYEAAFNYDPARNVRFSSYAYMVIRSRIINVLRDYYRTYKEESFSIDATEYPECHPGFAVCDAPFLYHREQELLKRFSRFYSRLSAEDRRILELRNRRCSYRQISRELNISVKRVDNRLHALRGFIRKMMEEETEKGLS